MKITCQKCPTTGRRFDGNGGSGDCDWLLGRCIGCLQSYRQFTVSNNHQHHTSYYTQGVEGRINNVVEPELFFSDLDPTFQSDSEPSWIFSNILNINITGTFVFPSCKCVRLHILTRYELFMDIFLKEFIFLVWAFLIRNCQILSVFLSSFTSNSFLMRIRIMNDFFRLKVAESYRIR